MQHSIVKSLHYQTLVVFWNFVKFGRNDGQLAPLTQSVKNLFGKKKKNTSTADKNTNRKKQATYKKTIESGAKFEASHTVKIILSVIKD